MNALHRVWSSCTDGIQTFPFWVGLAIGLAIGLGLWLCHEFNEAPEVKDHDQDDTKDEFLP